MKISMISTLPPIKGLSPYTLGLVKELSKQCEIDFYGFKKIYPEFLYPGGTKTNEEEPRIQNVKIINNLTWYNPFSWIKTGFSIKTDIVHAQWWSWFLAPVYLTVLGIAKTRKKKIIMTIHNVKPHEKSFLKNWLNKSVIKLADEYIVHNESNKELFLKETKTQKNVHVIPHGILEMKKSDLTLKQLRKKYSFNDKDKIMLFFGNIRDYKGLDILLFSLSQLQNKNIKLIIAGKPWENFEKYEAIIKEKGLDKQVRRFLEFNSQEKLSELFKVSDLVVFPYKEFEASSGAGASALFYEKPLIVTNVGGLTDLVKNKKVIAEPNNPIDLKEKIKYVLKNLRRLENESTKRKKEFSWNKIASKIGGVYRA